MLNYTWIDDGVYPVEITVEDEERDETVMILNVTVENRAPRSGFEATNRSGEYPITLYACANDSDSEKVWPGVVDIYWPLQLQKVLHPGVHDLHRGWKTAAVGTDDDRATATATFDVKFTNIRPHSINVQMVDDDGPVVMDAQDTWHVSEDQTVTIKGQAQDSVDDIEDLTHTWWPDDAQPSLIRVFDGRTSEFEMVWLEAGLHKMRLEVTDSEGASSGIEERWVSVQNVPPTIEPIASVLPVAEGQTISVSGSSSDTASDIDTLVRCWDIDPSMDSDDIGSADDDCDVIGDDLTIAWNRSGTHKLVYHVTDDDGATTSEVLEVLVLNTPPIVGPVRSCVAYGMRLDASLLGALTDINLTVAGTWMSRWTATKTGSDNDADPIGKTVSYIFKQDGVQSVKVIAWDEDPERPGTKVVTFAVLPADRTPLENLGASLVGEEANPIAQLSLLVLMLLLVGLFSRRRRQPEATTDAWDEVNTSLSADLFTSQEERIQQRRPEGPPPAYLFQQALEQAPGTEPHAGPPLPPAGLPEGWTLEQWEHYGQQYLDSQG